MVAAVVIVAVVFVAAAILWRRNPNWPDPPVWKAGVFLGIWIAGIRLVVFWTCAYWLETFSDGRQVVAFVLLIVDAVVELNVAGPWQQDRLAWWILVSALITTTSLSLGLLLAYVRAFLNRKQPQT